MFWSTVAIIVAALHAFDSMMVVSADQVLDLGSLDQYNNKDKGPSLSGNTLWMTGREGQDIIIALSSDLQGQVKSALDTCAGDENKCFQAIIGVFRSSDLAIDGQINRRGFAQLLSKTFKKISAPIMAFAAILIAEWKGKHEPSIDLSHYWNLPTGHAGQVATISDGVPLTVSAAGSAVMTVTPPPEPMSITGSITPAVTSVATSTEGYSPGDLIISMDPGLASRLGELMRRMTQCQEGMAFDSGSTSKRDGGTYGGAVCGAMGAISMATPGGLFHDVLLVNAPRFVFTAGQVADAAQVVVNFARDYAPLLDVPADVAENIAHYFFALAIDTIMDNVPLGEKNPVRHSIISGTVTAPPTTSTCSTNDACEVSCEEMGIYFYFCETSCSSGTVCATATGSTDADLKTVTTVLWTPAALAVPTATAQPQPKCSMDKPGTIQWNVFYGEQYNVANQFCDQVGKNQASVLAWNVDINGNMIPPKLHARSPPVTPNTYKDYKMGLRWTPKDGFNAATCSQDCKSTYQKIANGPCGHTGGESNVMAMEGSWDIGCGEYAWNIIVPEIKHDPWSKKVPLTLSAQECFTETNFPRHADVQGYDVSVGAAFACADVPASMNAKSPKWTPPKPLYGRSGYELKFEIEWKGGCVTDVVEQNPKNPLGAEGETNVCYGLFLNNWRDCTGNHGVGGWIDAGCLTYYFSPGKGGK